MANVQYMHISAVMAIICLFLQIFFPIWINIFFNNTNCTLAVTNLSHVAHRLLHSHTHVLLGFYIILFLFVHLKKIVPIFFFNVIFLHNDPNSLWQHGSHFELAAVN